MKRNLSKNTAKALAVGLAVGLGSSAAISGVSGSLATVSAAAPTIQGDIAYDSGAKTITLTFNEELKVGDGSTTEVTGFTVTKDGTEVTVNSQAFGDSQNKIVLGLDSELEAGEYVVNYQAVTDKAIQNATDEAIADGEVGRFTVEATQQVEAPEFESAVIENTSKNIIKVTFNKEVAEQGDISALFTVNKDAAPLTGATAAIDTANSKIINITLPTEAKNGETYTISYTQGTDNFISDKVDTTVKVADFADKTVTNNVEATTPSVSVAENDDITVGDFKFKVLADTTKVALIGRESTTTRASHTGSNLSNGTLQVDGKTLTITQIGDGTNPLTGTFTTNELNTLCKEATIIKTKAFDGVAVTGGSNILFPKVEEVGPHSLAFKSGITKVELLAVKNADKISTSAFKSATKGQTSSVTQLVVADSIKTQVMNKLGTDSGITSINGTNVNPSGSGSNQTTTTTKPSGGSGAGAGAVINSAGQLETTTVEASTEPTTQYITKNLSLDKVSLPEITEASKSFADVMASHWASSAISRLASAGIINGMPDGSFNLNGNTKRADMTVMLVRLLGLNETFSGNFSDVPENAYYANAVGLAREYGIVTGSTDGRF
ncbi:MAG: S-layer homology domain-containing protein, partial [Eubacteriales bacterium]|nr:S-layer homology domain-containing protein [Eubacteriales bacterium]